MEIMTPDQGARAGPLGGTGPPIPELVGSGPAMQQVYRLVRQVARSTAPVLLQGETGTGKQLIAEAIHRLSGRGSRPFVRIHCGTLTEEALEVELFGHAGDQDAGRKDAGGLGAANAGSLCLDEIDAMPPRLQARLLEAMHGRALRKPGQPDAGGLDVRMITASGHELLEEVEAGRFREDLYYRLAVVTIGVPPLRRRREDIPELAAHFLDASSRQNGRPVSRFEHDAVEALQAYDWPGNVGELASCIARAVVLAPGDEVTCDLLPEKVLGRGPRRLGPYRGMDLPALASQLVEQGISTAGSQADDLHGAIVNRVERELIVQVMAACEGVQTKAAARLGINRNTLHKKLKEYGLER